MRIIATSTVKQFARRHRKAAGQLNRWVQMTEGANWTCLADVRAVFPHADGVALENGKIMTVFNICGNDFRLITAINYEYRIVYIREFLTHAEYSKNQWKERQ